MSPTGNGDENVQKSKKKTENVQDLIDEDEDCVLLVEDHSDPDTLRRILAQQRQQLTQQKLEIERLKADFDRKKNEEVVELTASPPLTPKEGLPQTPKKSSQTTKNRKIKSEKGKKSPQTPTSQLDTSGKKSPPPLTSKEIAALEISQQKKASEQKAKKALDSQRKMMASIFKPIPKRLVQTIDGSGMAFFLPYEIQDGVRLAPKLRVVYSPSKAESLTEILRSPRKGHHVQRECLYVGELKSKSRRPGKYPATCARGDPGEVTVLTDTKSNVDRTRLKVKLIQFSENARPPYYGTMRRKSRVITGRNPFLPDLDSLDYEVDSDEEWEEQQAVGDADDCEEETKSEDEEDDKLNDFLDHDTEEMQSHNESNADGLADDEDDIRPVRSSVENWMKQKKVLRLKKRIIGPHWEDQMEECHKLLKKLSIVTIIQEIGEVLKSAVAHQELGFGVSKMPENIMPLFIRLLHGSLARKGAFAKTFLELWDGKDGADVSEKFSYVDASFRDIFRSSPRPKHVNKAAVVSVVKAIATWTKPIAVEKVRQQCWYVREDVRHFYKVLEGPALPNPAALRVVAKKRKAGEMEPMSPEIPFAKAPKLDFASLTQKSISTLIPRRLNLDQPEPTVLRLT